MNYLAPNVVNGPWTAEEEQLLVRKYKQFGPSWKRIATCFNGRTDINVRNRWLLMQRRTHREAASRVALTSPLRVHVAHPQPADGKRPPETTNDPFFIIDDQQIPDGGWLQEF
jgi:hypothetical protein